MSRTGTPHTSTISSLTSLLTLRADPPYKLVSKTRLDTTRILAQLHLHIVQELHHLLLIYRIKYRTPALACGAAAATLEGVRSHAHRHLPLPPRGGRW
jgi:hypothetical protein